MSAITNRYACAFADVVLDKHLVRHQTGQDLALIAQLMESSRELRTIWQNPSVEGVQKRKVLDWIAARAGTSKMVRNFIAVLIDRHRLQRQYLPKKTDLSRYAQSHLDKVALRLNQRPRKTLGFETPASRLRASVASTG